MMYVGVFNPLKKPKGMAGDLFYWKARIRYILRFTPQEKPKWTIVDNFIVLDVVVVVLFSFEIVKSGTAGYLLYWKF